MADNPSPVNAVRPAAVGRSVAVGDVPDALRTRYLTESGRLGGGLAFYVDATIVIPSFRDRGRELVAIRSDPNTVRDLVAIAQHRGWTSVRLQGAEGFRREAWLAGRTAGLEVDGYRPTERDEQLLARRLTARDQRETIQAARDPETTKTQTAQGPEFTGAGQRMRVAEAVVRSRVADPAVQARILAGARTRIAELLERGARFDDLRDRRRRPAEPERRR